MIALAIVASALAGLLFITADCLRIARRQLRRTAAQLRQTNIHAQAIECQRDAARCERDRAYETSLALSHQVEQLEQQLAESRRPMILPCGAPLVEIPVDRRFVVTVANN